MVRSWEVETRESERENASLRLARLAGVCERSELAFAQAIQTTSCTEFRACMGRIRQLLHEYGVHLQIELSNLEGAGVARLQRASGGAAGDWEFSLGNVLDSYTQVLDSYLPLHIRDMVERQFDHLQQLFEEFNRFVSVLQSLIVERAGSPRSWRMLHA